jgi:hypothetical protein
MLYDKLPVYKVSYDLLTQIFELIKWFQRDYKYTLWESIKKEILNLIISIYKTNSHIQKLEHIQSARESIETVRILIRLSKDLKQINLDKFIEINKMIESISKQLSAWERYYRK